MAELMNNFKWDLNAFGGMPQSMDMMSGSGADYPPPEYAGINLRNTTKGADSNPYGLWNYKDPVTKETQLGKLGQGIGAFTGLANAYLGWQQFSIAKQQMDQNKKIFNLNFANQAQTTNTQLEDRQRARVASHAAGDVESVDSYMARNRVSGQGI
jgi:hypothetical protein